MRPGFEKRLQRLRAGLMQAEAAALARRRSLQVRVEVGAALRRMLVERGVDPAGIAMMRLVDEAAAELAALPDGARAENAAPADPASSEGGRAADEVIARLAALCSHYADGRRPDPARSSLMEWHAWCLVTPPAAALSRTAGEGNIISVASSPSGDRDAAGEFG